jgi:large subunit ribosomal protein L34e
MVEGKKRSRTFRRVFVKTPGGRTIIHYKKRKPQKPHCAACKNVLPGVVRARAAVVKQHAKTERRPERPFAGMLCSRCMRQEFVRKARNV